MNRKCPSCGLPVPPNEWASYGRHEDCAIPPATRMLADLVPSSRPTSGDPDSIPTEPVLTQVFAAKKRPRASYHAKGNQDFEPTR